MAPVVVMFQSEESIATVSPLSPSATVPFAASAPETVSEESVPTEVSEEAVTPEPRVVAFKTEVPAIW